MVCVSPIGRSPSGQAFAGNKAWISSQASPFKLYSLSPLQMKGVVSYSKKTRDKSRHLGDVVGHGGIVEVRIDVVVDTVGHALEEFGHVPVPRGLPGPGGVVEHVHWEDLEEHVLHTRRICEQLETSTFATHQRNLVVRSDGRDNLAQSTIVTIQQNTAAICTPYSLLHAPSSFSM